MQSAEFFTPEYFKLLLPGAEEEGPFPCPNVGDGVPQPECHKIPTFLSFPHEHAKQERASENNMDSHR